MNARKIHFLETRNAIIKAAKRLLKHDTGGIPSSKSLNF